MIDRLTLGLLIDQQDEFSTRRRAKAGLFLLHSQGDKVNFSKTKTHLLMLGGADVCLASGVRCSLKSCPRPRKTHWLFLGETRLRFALLG